MYPLQRRPSAGTSPFLLPILFLLLFSADASGQGLLPLKPGMAVATCASFFNVSGGPDFVIGVIDMRDPPANLAGQNWQPPMYHGPNDSWTAQNLGQLFGVCLDEEGNIYATATTSYGPANLGSPEVGPAGRGGVYKLDGRTGEISIFARLPNTGPALGNICYDREHRQFFVTNFEDGKIYRLSPAGTVLSTFDFYAPDDGAPGITPLGERAWGVAVYANRLYYGVWWADFNQVVQPRGNEIRSVGLSEEGEFLNDDRNEFDVPSLGGIGGIAAISDIAFSTDGRMVIAERSMRSDLAPIAHLSRIREYGGVPGNWVHVQDFQIGNLFMTSPELHANAAGGVDFGYGAYDAAGDRSTGCDEAIWATGDALRFAQFNPDGTFDYVYGLARIPASGNSPQDVTSTSYYIDLDGNTTQAAKTLIGDVEVLRYSCYPPETADYICGTDTARLHAPRGATYRWTPAEGLSCTDCREPLAAPDSTTVYTVEVTDAQGSVTRYTRTVRAAPVPTYTISIGEPETEDEKDRIVSVPVVIAPAPDPLGARRFVAEVTYPPGFLLMENGAPPSLEDLLRETIAEGWRINVIESRPGLFRAEFTAPPGAPPLRDSGVILRLEFRQLLADLKLQSPLSVRIDFPEAECTRVRSVPDTIDYEICGLDERLMEFTRYAYALNVAPTVVTDQVNVNFTLAFDGRTRIELYDITGALAAVLLDRDLSDGEFYLVWRTTVPPGVYYLRITSGGWTEVQRLVIVK